jgi:hypothetical protein
MRDNLLFNTAEIFQLRDMRRQKLEAEISAIEANRILGSSVEDLAAYFVERFTLTVPTLHVEEAVADQHEGQVQRYDHWEQMTFTVTGTIVELTIPFEGDGSLFGVRASTFGGLDAGTAEVGANQLTLRIAAQGQSSERVRQQLDQQIAGINEKLGWLRADAQTFNAALPGLARQWIEQRRGKLLADQRLVANLGFKLKKRPDALTTYAVPLAKRHVQPRFAPSSTAPFKPEPTLADDDYQNILHIVENMALVMERSPSAFEEIKEEDLRVHFLVQLNGQYEGQATGETFNFGGKTDILVRADDKNIFIAERKYWHGAKGHSDTIDQVLSYLSWRDTKAAIIVFNRNRGFSKVLAEIKASTTAHPLRKSGPVDESETRSRYVFGQKSDPSREVILTVLAFDVPCATA